MNTCVDSEEGRWNTDEIILNHKTTLTLPNFQGLGHLKPELPKQNLRLYPISLPIKAKEVSPSQGVMRAVPFFVFLAAGMASRAVGEKVVLQIHTTGAG